MSPTSSPLTFSGGIHLITLRTRRRWPWLLDPDICLRVLRLFEMFRRRHELRCYGYVLLADRLQAVVEQTDGKPAIERCLTDFRRESSFMFRGLMPEGEFWRPRAEDLLLADAPAVESCLADLHGLPVASRLADEPTAYRWSSARDASGAAKGLIEVAPLPQGCAV